MKETVIKHLSFKKKSFGLTSHESKRNQKTMRTRTSYHGHDDVQKIREKTDDHSNKKSFSLKEIHTCFVIVFAQEIDSTTEITRRRRVSEPKVHENT